MLFKVPVFFLNSNHCSQFKFFYLLKTENAKSPKTAKLIMEKSKIVVEV